MLPTSRLLLAPEGEIDVNWSHYRLGIFHWFSNHVATGYSGKLRIQMQMSSETDKKPVHQIPSHKDVCWVSREIQWIGIDAKACANVTQMFNHSGCNVPHRDHLLCAQSTLPRLLWITVSLAKTMTNTIRQHTPLNTPSKKKKAMNGEWIFDSFLFHCLAD